jgi:hypothetical protein
VIFKLDNSFIIKALEHTQASVTQAIVQLAPFERFKLHKDSIINMVIVNDKLFTFSMDHTIGFTNLDSISIHKIITLGLKQAITSVSYIH